MDQTISNTRSVTTTTPDDETTMTGSLDPANETLARTKPVTRRSRTLQSIEDQAMDIYRAAGYTGESLTNTVIENLYVITWRFDRTPYGYKRNDYNGYFRKFSEFYKNVAHGIQANHYQRAARYHPLAYAFLDHPGSRQQAKRSDPIGPATGRGVFDQTRNHAGAQELHSGIHLHSPMLVKPSYGQKCHAVLQEYMQVAANRKNPDLLIEKFDPTKSTHIQTLGYCSKGCNRLENETGQNAWQMYGRGYY